MLPVIGIPAGTRISRGDVADYCVRASYCTAIVAAGGAPLLIPPAPAGTLRSVYERLDGLLLAGGGDVSPEQYGGVDAGTSLSTDPVRDAMELTLACWALADSLPILAICRGIQALNVAAGGSLIQDIPAEVGSSVLHRVLKVTPKRAHSVQMEPGSRLAAIYAEYGAVGPVRVRVNSRHHQAVGRLAEGFASTASSADGLVEAIEPIDRDGRFCLGVQWHPEDLAPDDAASQRLFAAFCAACAQRSRAIEP